MNSEEYGKKEKRQELKVEDEIEFVKKKKFTMTPFSSHFLNSAHTMLRL
jgi:hypothetical protein